MNDTEVIVTIRSEMALCIKRLRRGVNRKEFIPSSSTIALLITGLNLPAKE
jgi:hypothetical protein